MTIRYAEHAPGPGLADVVRCYWTISGDAPGADNATVNRVLPDNCIDVIFDLRQASAFVVGPMLTAEVMPRLDAIDLLGMRFSPGAGTEFVDASAASLTVSHVDAADVWPDAPLVLEQLLDTARGERAAVLDTWLGRRRRSRRESSLARRAAAAIERSGGRLTVERLAAVTSASDRTLLRTFRAAVGISPKEMLRVQRFRVAAARLEHAGDERSIARVAAECGYADQSHLTREFSAIGGLTPSAFRAERRLVGFVQA